MDFTKEYILFLLKNYRLIHGRMKKSKRIRIFEKNLRTLLYAIEKLDDNTKQIIQDLYLNGLTWQETMAKYYISHSTISRKRKKALQKIAEVMESEIA